MLDVHLPLIPVNEKRMNLVPCQGKHGQVASVLYPLMIFIFGRKLNLTENLLASGAAVVGATVFTHPIDVVKVQLQMAEKSCAKADSFSELAALW